MKKGFLAVTAVLVFAAIAWTQNYPPQIPVDVTFYDQHSDGSNPDFNSGTNPATWLTGMVQNTLDADWLPVRGPNLLYSYEINKWFKPWPQGNDYERPVYANAGKTLAQLTTVAYNTSYQNIVIPHEPDIQLCAWLTGAVSVSKRRVLAS